MFDKIIEIIKKIIDSKKYNFYPVKHLCERIKRNIKTFIIVLIAAILVIALCVHINFEYNVTISKISINYTELTLCPEETAELYATVLLSNNKQHNNVTWSSNNSDIVSIDKYGKITAHKKGTAEITAQANRFGKFDVAVCTVNVKTAPMGYSIFLSAYTASTKDIVRVYINTKPEDEVTNIIVYGIAPSGKPFPMQLSDRGYNFCAETGRWKVYATIENSIGSYTGTKPDEIAYIDISGEICDGDDDLQGNIEELGGYIFSELFGQ